MIGKSAEYIRGMIILSLVIGHAELNVYKLIWKKSFAELEANAFAECMHVVHVLILYSDSLHSYNQRTRINGQIASHRGRSLDLLSAVWQTADNKCPVATVNCWVPSVAAADPELWWVGRKKRVIDWGVGGAEDYLSDDTTHPSRASIVDDLRAPFRNLMTVWLVQSPEGDQIDFLVRFRGRHASSAIPDNPLNSIQSIYDNMIIM